MEVLDNLCFQFWDYFEDEPPTITNQKNPKLGRGRSRTAKQNVNALLDSETKMLSIGTFDGMDIVKDAERAKVLHRMLLLDKDKPPDEMQLTKCGKWVLVRKQLTRRKNEFFHKHSIFNKIKSKTKLRTSCSVSTRTTSTTCGNEKEVDRIYDMKASVRAAKAKGEALLRKNEETLKILDTTFKQSMISKTKSMFNSLKNGPEARRRIGLIRTVDQ